MSVNCKDAGMLYPPKSIQMHIFEKAGKLFYGEEEVITKVKGTEKDIFMVPSTSSGSNPHRVKINENGLVECDEQCLRFKCYKICSHTAAVAEFHGVLYQFIDKFEEKKKRKISCIVDVRVPPNVGTKKLKLHSEEKVVFSKKVLTPTPISPHLGQIFKQILPMRHKSRLKT